MDGKHIPGFYWDPEKKKYFGIQHRRDAQKLNLKHSVTNVQKEELKKRIRKNSAARVQRIRKERVVRPYATHIAHTVAQRELGCRKSSFHVRHTWPDACMSGMTSPPKQVLEKPPNASIRYFERDPVSKTIYAVHGDNSILRRRIHNQNGPPLPKEDIDASAYCDHLSLNAYSFEPWDELTRTMSPVSSLSYLPASGALAVTTYGSERPPTVYLSDPEQDGPYVGQIFTPKACSTIWGAAARPPTFSPSQGLTNSVQATDTEHLAVAASRSLLLFSRSPTGSWDSRAVTQFLDSDILAVDWISYTTIAYGCRDGKIYLHDTRSGGCSHILTHPYPVSKIKRADDDTRLLCSGLQDSLFLFDIRSPRLSRSASQPFNYKHHHYNSLYFETRYPGARQAKKRRTMNHAAYRNWSPPILSFTQHNFDDLELAVDVYPRLGLVAASQDPDTGEAIRVSNIWTGKTVKEWCYNEDKGRAGDKAASKIRSLKFVDEGGELELWTCWEGGVARFGW